MCVSPEKIRQIVHDELDSKLVDFMEKVDITINERLKHVESSPQTKNELQKVKEALAKHNEEERAHWGKIDKILEFQEQSTPAINAVKDLLAGSRVLKASAQVFAWVGAVIAGFVGIRLWLLDK